MINIVLTFAIKIFFSANLNFVDTLPVIPYTKVIVSSVILFTILNVQEGIIYEQK